MGKTLGGLQGQSGRGGPPAANPDPSVTQALVATNMERNVSDTIH